MRYPSRCDIRAARMGGSEVLVIEEQEIAWDNSRPSDSKDF